MAATRDSKSPVDAATPTTVSAQHDRVAMLSLNADGTPRDFNPEIIIPRDEAAEETGERLAQQSVAAVGPVDPDVPAEATVETHQAVADAARSQAVALVDAHHPDAPARRSR